MAGSFSLLVKKLEECSSDGVGCELCPVAAECTACWDRICREFMLDEYGYSEFEARLTELMKRKRSVADGMAK